MIKLKGMYGSMVRCIISEDIPASDIPKEFGRVRDEGRAILVGARAVLDFGGRHLSEELIFTALREFVWPSGVYIAAWITYDTASQEMLKKMGLATTEPTVSSAQGGSRADGTLFLRRNLRSGQRVEHNGDVIIIGHVNETAEVAATGSVIVLGKLSGLVHAGCDGNNERRIITRSLEATQLRIGSKMGSLDREEPSWGKMVIVSVKNDSVFIDYWPSVKSDADESI
ncbi:putative septum site-determining protein MinC [Synergistales bacterium]|nr:putative septum site-determining protein MinC [Synergistales bacterium]